MAKNYVNIDILQNKLYNIDIIYLYKNYALPIAGRAWFLFLVRCDCHKRDAVYSAAFPRG